MSKVHRHGRRTLPVLQEQTGAASAHSQIILKGLGYGFAPIVEGFSSYLWEQYKKLKIQHIFSFYQALNCSHYEKEKSMTVSSITDL